MKLQIPIVSMLAQHAGVVWRFSRARVLFLLFLMTLTAISEGFGITLLLPFLTHMNITEAGSDRGSELLNTILARAGVPTSTTAIVVLIVVVFIFKGTLTFCTMVYQAYVNARLFQSFRNRLIAAYAALDYRYYLERHSGYFTNVITMEVERSVTFFSIYLTVVSFLVNVVVFLSVSFLINAEFTSLAIVFGSAVMVTFQFVGLRAQRYSLERSRENGRFQSQLIETVQSFKYLTSTAGFGRLTDQLFQNNERIVWIELRLNSIASIIHAFSESIVVIGMMALIYYEVVVLGNSLAPLVVAVMLFYRSMMAITGLQKNWQNLCASVGGVDTVTAAIRDLDAHQERRGYARASVLRQAIELRGVSISFGDKPVLKNLTLRIPRNSLVAVVGESGAGKSTLVDLISGILAPDQGTVLIDGTDLRSMDGHEWRKRIGYVPQEGALFDDTFANNISMWSCNDRDAACLDRIKEAARRASCEEFIGSNSDGYQTKIGDRGVRMSGGQRQRLSIARELFKEPDILILDEATSALDSEMELDVQRSIDKLKGRATIIMIAHRLSTIRNCDRIFVLEHGTVAEEGSFATLLTRGGKFAQMCALQNLSPDLAGVGSGPDHPGVDGGS